MIRIRRALISVFDKEGVVDFGRTLAEFGVEILSTGATARALEAAGLVVVPIERVTRWPEMFDGRVKTLTPQIHGGLLMRRDHAADCAEADQHGIAPIDLLCVNLYPFQETVARTGVTRQECLEMIDIGGPAMVRAAAKNHRDVVVVCGRARYADIAAELRANRGAVSRATAAQLAIEAFAATAAYDAAVFRYLWSSPERRSGATPEEVEVAAWPEHWAAGGARMGTLRYGENPTQSASAYIGAHGLWTRLQQHQGKALSYNNLADLWAAWRCIAEFPGCACAVIKHATPSGVALASSPVTAFQRARDGDALSAFGGVVVFNRPAGKDVAAALSEMFLEVVAAPHWEAEALAQLARKKSLRVLTIPDPAAAELTPVRHQFKSLGDAALVQTPLPPASPASRWSQVAGPAVGVELVAELDFAWRVVRHVRSNAIALTRGLQTIGLGAGQTSRIDAVEIALHKAARCGHSTGGAVLASDAFFPFRDVADRAAAAGITAIVQPGGSRRDKESIDACNEHGMAMFFTGERVFGH